MSEPTDEELGIPEGLDPNIRQELRKSRVHGKEAAEAKAQAEASKRELEFYKAGVPEEGIGALIRKAYEGPMDQDSIKTFAAAHGLSESGAPAGVPSSDDADALIELERLRQMQQGSEGARPPGNPELRADFIKNVQQAKSADEIWALIEQKGPGVGVRRFTPN